MKPSILRRMRRRTASHEVGNAKKENAQEQAFFGEAVAEHFFQPAAVVQRKCEKCEEEDKNVQKKEDNKEDLSSEASAQEEKKEEKVMKKEDPSSEASAQEEEKVMKKEDPSSEASAQEEEKLQKKEDNKEEEKVMKKEDPSSEASAQEEEKLQKKETPGSSTSQGTVSGYVSSLNSKGTPLPANANQFFSTRLGYDFSNVKVHTDQEAASSAKAVHAKAYTVGNHVVFNDGQFDTASNDGIKLMAHELVHVMQQNGDEAVSRKGEEEAEPECTAGSVDLEAETSAVYKKGAGTAKNEVTKKSKNCNGCDDDSCVSITGSLIVPYSVATTVNLPPVPANLTPCQQDRVRTAINTTLSAHEQQHVKAFQTFNGTASLPLNYQGCSDGYVSYQEGLAEAEYERRKTAADAKSAALDPFSVPVDLCCKDKPKK